MFQPNAPKQAPANAVGAENVSISPPVAAQRLLTAENRQNSQPTPLWIREERSRQTEQAERQLQQSSTAQSSTAERSSEAQNKQRTRLTHYLRRSTLSFLTQTSPHVRVAGLTKRSRGRKECAHFTQATKYRRVLANGRRKKSSPIFRRSSPIFWKLHFQFKFLFLKLFLIFFLHLNPLGPLIIVINLNFDYRPSLAFKIDLQFI